MTKTVVFAEKVTPVMAWKRSCFRDLLDAWIVRGDAVAEDIYGFTIQNRPGNSVTCVVRNETDVEIVGSYKIATDINFPGREFLRQHLIPACRIAKRTQRPTSSSQLISADGLQISSEWLLLPEREGGTDGWCIAYVEVGFLLRVVEAHPIVDDIDLSLLQLLTEGFQMKEIANRVGLSYRTIEHRFEKMKLRMGARSLPHLAVLSMANALPSEIRSK